MMMRKIVNFFIDSPTNYFVDDVLIRLSRNKIIILIKFIILNWFIIKISIYNQIPQKSSVFKS